MRPSKGILLMLLVVMVVELTLLLTLKRRVVLLVKYSTGSLIGRVLTWWNSKGGTRGREATVGMTWEDFKALMKEEYCPINEMQSPSLGYPWYQKDRKSAILKAGVLTDEAVRNGSLKRSGEIRGDSEESRIFSRDCRVGPRMVNPLNARNLTAARGACYECGGNDHYKSACRRAFVIKVEEARQDPNIVVGTFSLYNHYAIILFDSFVDYIFVSTTFMPLLDIEPSSLGFGYEIKIASGQLVEINKVIRGCKLEIKGHTFDIDLIPFRHGSFDIIIGMD
nr:putative reverse transcriptase domain-containing protein [Tanacetum cinerariifolium]